MRTAEPEARRCHEHADRGLSGSGSKNTSMRTQQRRADELRIADCVLTADGTLLTVTSTRLQGVGAGVVSVGFAERPRRANYRPSEAMSVLVTPIRRTG